MTTFTDFWPIILVITILTVIPNAGGGEELGKLWKIAVGHDWGAHEYIDTDGYMRGFTRDLISAVCSVGDLRCRTVWDEYTNCWNSYAGIHSYGGEGLMDQWYDACTGWVPTANRMQVFDFSMSFFKNTGVHFFVKAGTNFDVTNITVVNKIGFLDGWFSDEKCLARISHIAGNQLRKKKIVHFNTTKDALSAVLDGQIDALFSTDYIWNDTRIEKAGKGGVPATFFCSSAGQAMMTRKDNEFTSVWNKAFQQLVSTGKFAELCKKSKQEHGHQGVLTPCV